MHLNSPGNMNALWVTIISGIKIAYGWLEKLFSFCKLYLVVYFIIGFFAKKKSYPETDKKHRFGIIICARNEHLVIGKLIDSIHAQDYDPSLLQVFVVADNCSDNTADICRAKGCTVYERTDPDHARKGFALKYLFERIRDDYGIESFDGYIMFDADNLLQNNFITELNKAFATGVGIAVGYRNTKNFDRNFISAGYAIHFMQSVVQLHRPRAILNTSTHIAGTGYVVASRLLKDGWNYTCLTEDTEFTLSMVAKGETIAFCEDAEFFDEQPYQVRVMVRQRMRWIKGRFAAFMITAPSLFKGVFTNKKRTFTCYDMLVYAFPRTILYGITKIIIPVLHQVSVYIIAFIAGKDLINAAGISTFLAGLIDIGVAFLLSWLVLAGYGALTVIRERKHINCKPGKLIFYTIMFPWFDSIGKILAIMSMFSTSQWRPIKHDAVISIDEITAKM